MPLYEMNSFLPFLLLIFGLILIFIEFYIPGAILGTIGAILSFASIVIFASQYHSWVFVILYIVGVLFLIALVIKLAVVCIRRASPDSSIYLDSSQYGYKASSYSHEAVGKKGVVLSDLKPGGYILINGIQYQAISEIGYIVKGSRIVVISGQEESLIVKLDKE